MSRYISPTLRKLVAERANYRCKYCRLVAMFSFFKFHCDHIVSRKHDGKTVAENLANACSVCNENKGTDIATFLDDLNNPIRFFNPRTDKWNEHFGVDDFGVIYAKTQIGAATVKIFGFNNPDSVAERNQLIRLGLFE